MNLKERSEAIDKKLIDHLTKLAESKQKAQTKQKEASNKYSDALKDGDLRENNAYEEAIKDLQNAKLEIVEREDEIAKINGSIGELENYVHTPYISEYSTVHLVLEEGDADAMGIPDEFVFKLFPNGTSVVDMGIISCDAGVGATLIDKQVGDKIRLKRDLLGLSAVYRIEDFY